MFRQKAALISSGILIIDLILTVAAFLLAYAVRQTFYIFKAYGLLAPFGEYLWLLFLVIPLWAFLLVRFKLYESFRTKPLWIEPWRIAQVVFWGTLTIGLLVFAFKWHFVSRTFIAVFAVLDFIILSVEKLFIRLLARYFRKRGFNYRNILIIGTGRRARGMAKVIETHKGWGLRVLGFIKDRPQIKLSVINGYRILGSIEDIPHILQTQVVDEVIFAVSYRNVEKFEDTFLLCEKLGINTRVAIDLAPHMMAKVHLDSLGNIPLLTFSTVPHNETLLLMKRIFDVCISSLMLLLSLPLFIILSIVIPLTSPGPVFFKQKRVGLNGRIFTLYKFRSMYVDAEEKLGKLRHLNEMNGPVFKIKSDPRVTPIGRISRKTSLDELPQFWNVLKGDMSIVGPRPPLPEEVKKYESRQRRRLSMRPGITCLWQIMGRNNVSDFDKWVDLDLQYIDNWSLELDMKIFLKTIPVVLFGWGAR